MRECGVLLHISSLPSKYGIGTLGKEAFHFVDFLKKSGQGYWQILPIGPTGFGDSPYQSYSAYAGNPLFIDLDLLIKDGILSSKDKNLKALAEKSEKRGFKTFEQLYEMKKPILFTAAKNFFGEAKTEAREKYAAFCAENKYWLDDYALFMTLKSLFGSVIWNEWEENIRLRDPDTVKGYLDTLSDEIDCYRFIQYIFYKQFFALKGYAAKNGVKLYGDMPIYVSADSADIWANRELFMLDKEGRPLKVAGCPPDDFSPTGQLWGNPLYDWNAMRKDGYSWWVNRVRYSAKLFDLTRIDHFRGFESFYAIPAGSKTAETGEWLKGPSSALFKAIKKELGDVNLVAEDLGFLTPEVEKMLKGAGYPGMNVLEFAFGGDDSRYLPHNFEKNSVTYIGTHDNDTALGWYNALDKKAQKRAKRYLSLRKSESVCYGMIRSVYASVSELVIIQMQDFLELGSEARMNIPSTVGNGNWAFRLKQGAINDKLAHRIRKLAELYFRAR